MNRRGAGVSFCFIAAFLFAIKYILIAIDVSGNLKTSVKGYMNIVVTISLIIGIIYIFLSEKNDI